VSTAIDKSAGELAERGTPSPARRGLSRGAGEAGKQGLGPRHPDPERFYLPELDVLRFFAFFAVFICHVPPYGPTQGALGPLYVSGAFGVDLFFTLSGYLLTSLLLRERDQTGDINVKAFYARRTLRIWPLYYFSIGLAFLLTRIPASVIAAPPFPGNLFEPIQPISYFFMAIFLFNFDLYGSFFTNPSFFMTQLWSISIEEQFYLFWPWLVRYVPRRRIVVLPLLMIAVSVIARIALPLNVFRQVWTNTFTRLDPIAVGILIALMPRLNLRPVHRAVLVIVGLVGWEFAAYYCGLYYQLSILKISMGYPAVALGSGAFLLATLGAESLRSDSVIVRSLVYLGKISYGLYVYDLIAIFIGRLLLFRGALGTLVSPGNPPWTALPIYLVLAFGLNVALAAVSYRFLESPFLRLKERFARVPSRAV
jgi:peptidoglycan/LPS O-acetylase OafA/YrhL